MKFTITLAALLFASTTVLAVPVWFNTRDVWVPQIAYPIPGAVWTVGETYAVVWDTNQKPAQVDNPIGTIYLSANGILDLGG